MAQSRSELRQVLRERRRSLSAEQQSFASEGLLQVLKQSEMVLNKEYYALYLAADGEIDPINLQHYLWSLNKSCYLPVISKKEMLFARYRPSTKLVSNKFGILEPLFCTDDLIDVDQLDVVFMPLTGFDLSGARLGMGGGFYDRTFSQTALVQSALLVGLAHECQKVDKIPTEDWDVPVAGVVTNKTSYFF